MLGIVSTTFVAAMERLELTLACNKCFYFSIFFYSLGPQLLPWFRLGWASADTMQVHVGPDSTVMSLGLTTALLQDCCINLD